jgi:GTP cyclohydrolase IA
MAVEAEVAQRDVIEARIRQQVDDDRAQPGGDDVRAVARPQRDDHAVEDLDRADDVHEVQARAGHDDARCVDARPPRLGLRRPAALSAARGGAAAVAALHPAGLADRDGGPAVDRHAAERAVGDLLVALGRDVGEPGLRETPRRVAAAFSELLTHEPVSLTTFANDAGYDELVVVREIPFHSLCMHHLLPFHGVAHVAYLPGERIIGLSKLARVVELFARELQLQERLTMQVADCLQEHLRPKGVGVVLEAEHLCMSLRGVQKAGTRTTTSALLGLLRDDARTRQEFLSLVRG